MIETDNGLQVVDNDTGDELGEILGADLSDMALVTEESSVKKLLIINDGSIASAEVPWLRSRSEGMPELFRVGDAVYAFSSDTVWRTDDGRTWVDVGRPSFLESADRITALSGHRLVAWTFDTPITAWETTDGLNWDAVDLPPLPSTSGPFGPNPLRIGTGWFAGTGSLGGYLGGNAWWMKADDTWVTLTDLGIEGNVPGVSVTGIDATTFLLANSGRHLWVLRLDESR
jgi:hypothetical protein